MTSITTAADGISFPEPGEIRAWLRSAWQGPTSIAIIFIVVVVLTLLGDALPNRDMILDTIGIPITGWASFELWRTSRHPDLDRQTQQAWLACAIAQLWYTLANVVRTTYMHVLHLNPAGSLADLFYVMCIPFLLWGFLRFPIARRTRGDVVKWWLDAAIVIIAGGTVVWYLILGPVVQAQHTSLITTIVAMIYPVGDLVLLLAVVMALLSRPLAVSKRAIQMAAFAAFLALLMDLAYSYTMVTGGMQLGGFVYVGYYVSISLWSLAAQYQRWRATQPQSKAESESDVSFTVSVMPYVAALIGYALLITVARPHWATTLGEVLASVLALTGVVLIRQLIAVRENAQLLTEQMSQESRFRSLMQNSSDVVTIIDGTGVIRFISPALQRNFGWAPETAVGKPVTALVHHDDVDSAAAFVEKMRMEYAPSAVGVWRCRNRMGEWRHVETVATNLLHDPTVRGIILNARDVTERMVLQAELRHQAYHDPLTQLANRAWFQSQVLHALTRAEHTPGSVAVLFLDLDNFKNVNDSLGHAAGDAMLFEVAARLLNATRGSDTVARLGGDEFAVLVERVTSEKDLTIIADRMTAAMRAPFSMDSGDVYMGVSIGIARSVPGQSDDELLRNADVAMYVSKRQGKGKYTVFESDMHAVARDRLGLETELRSALLRGELSLMFQPFVALNDHHVIGAEALVRWRHPTRGWLPPGEFIPLAEESGLILPLGRWVLHEACHQGARWRSQLPAGASFTVSVNVSAQQLQHAMFVDDVAAALRETGLPPADLLLEITESVIVRDVQVTLQRLNTLKALGVRLAIDDFGTGYSSLSFLQQFPIDVLKIDKSFVNEAAVAGNGPALARTIVSLGHTLSMQTVAEGIEYEQQAEALTAMGCTIAQGFHFSRPVPASTIDVLLQGQFILPQPVIATNPAMQEPRAGSLEQPEISLVAFGRSSPTRAA